jgi:hypothetical protein
MSEQFKVGDVCVWQNCVGEWGYLNGVETIITGDKELARNLSAPGLGWAYMTDTPHPYHPGDFLLGDSSELRKKWPPTTTGEQLIRTMFDAPPIDRRQPATAWMAQYDTAQALMAMGVRVRVGEWPVEGEA